MRDGRLVFERYYNGETGKEPREIYSITKSVLSALVGIALHDGRLQSLDQKLIDFFPQELGAGADPRVRAITLRHLLTMTAGYENAPPGSVRSLMNRPLRADPGTRFSYDNGTAHLLAAVLTKATGSIPAALARHELFAPLGIRDGGWYRDEQGRSLGNTGLSLRPRDLLKLGQLYLRRGRWGLRQVVPEAWARETTRIHVRRREGCGYGYLWWVCPHLGFYAFGHAGQMIAVYPRRRLVVVATADGDVQRIEVEQLILNAVVR